MTPAADAIGRHKERAGTSRAELYAVLDDALVATLSTVRQGRPWVVPMLFARDGDRLIVHGSTGAGALRHVAAGAPVALSVTHLDGIVVAHTTFESSANYRSAVVHGVLEPVSAADSEEVLDLLSDRIIPGRVAEVRPSNPKERAATLALQLRIIDGQWTLKSRTGWSDEPDEPTDAWIGIVPMAVAPAAAQTAPFSPTDQVPASVQRLTGGLG
ncbi:MAG: pyridoxamine 5'-phosphate oxidase family protein [Nostocoides sp.]